MFSTPSGRCLSFKIRPLKTTLGESARKGPDSQPRNVPYMFHGIHGRTNEAKELKSFRVTRFRREPVRRAATASSGERAGAIPAAAGATWAALHHVNQPDHRAQIHACQQRRHPKRRDTATSGGSRNCDGRSTGPMRARRFPASLKNHPSNLRQTRASIAGASRLPQGPEKPGFWLFKTPLGPIDFAATEFRGG
jgi:hypothetical protein